MRLAARLLAALATSSLAAAQSFYVDLEGTTAPTSTPSASFGAAAARPGVWNVIRQACWNWNFSVVDVTGAPTNLVLTSFVSSCDDPTADQPTGATGDEAALLDDYLQDFGLCGVQFRVTGLAPGDYRVYAYTWFCDANVSVTGSTTPLQFVSTLGYPGGLVAGRDYAVAFVRGLTNGEITLNVVPAFGCGGTVGAACGGFQVVRAPGALVCAGDALDAGVTTPCPCGNVGALAHGCAHSGNANGALLDADGVVGQDDVSLRADGMPGTSSCIYLQGDAATDVVFGDGVRCAGGNLLRLRVRSNTAGASAFPDASDTVTLSQHGGVAPGSGLTRWYQTYYRNATASFCPPATFNVTNGVRIDW